MLCTDIIKSKISGSSSGGGGSSLLELTTTFKADGETVYIASCNGDSYITAPPTPTSTSGSFVGWTNEDGDVVTFPYFPDETVVLEAEFKSVRTEMEWLTSGDWFTDNYYTTPAVRKKLNNEKTIMASVKLVGISYVQYYVMLGTTESSVETSTTVVAKDNFEYDGQTYYYSIFFNQNNHNISNVIDKSILLDTLPNSYYGNYEAISKGVLDYYFMR